MELIKDTYFHLSEKYDELWELRDRRVDGWFLMGSPWPTILLCATYVYIVKVAGPKFMKNREPMNIRWFLIAYNFLQVILSTYLFVSLLLNGWGGEYSFRCQPVDYSNNPKALHMVWLCWLYYFSKFTEFFDTFCFIARKKFSHVSLLHVVHHGIMPLSVWPGARWVPGGHASFFGLLNTFVHIFMYTYYMFAAMGPKYQKYIWWKQHMTTLQMVQFVGIMVHGFQLLFYKDCKFPWQYGPYIAMHAVLFFILFSQFYIKEYFHKKPKEHKNGTSSKDSNGIEHKSNGVSSTYNLRNGNKKTN